MESMKNEKLLEKALGLLPTLYENKVPAQRAVEFTKENGKKVEFFGDLVDFKKEGKGEEICDDNGECVLCADDDGAG